MSDVDFLRRTVHVERQRRQDGSVVPSKTKASVRTIPLASLTLQELAAHLAAYPSDEWLFTNQSGRPIGYQHWPEMWNGAEPGDLTTHDLRHS